MGSNGTIKQWVARGELCFICEQNPPANFDTLWKLYRGTCVECYLRIENMRMLYALEGGYVRREEYKPDEQ